MRSTPLNRPLPLAMMALVAAGCGSTQPDATAQPEPRVSATGVAAVPTTRPAEPLEDAGDAAAQWTSFRDFWFDSNRSELQSSASEQVSDIANYVRRHPEQRVGIDGAIDPRRAELSNRRRISIRNALLRAGVPANRIETGDFGNPQLRRDLRVEVLVGNR